MLKHLCSTGGATPLDFRHGAPSMTAAFITFLHAPLCTHSSPDRQRVVTALPIPTSSNFGIQPKHFRRIALKFFRLKLTEQVVLRRVNSYFIVSDYTLRLIANQTDKLWMLWLP